ncbi:MAG: yxnA [Candidatus Saccharibacteria bacterium]|nr:yxnA [Candidatus Saccharibacteria bacterium]
METAIPTTIVITGASSGIGRALAERVASHNTHLVLVARGEKALSSIVALCRQKGAVVSPVVADVAIAEDVERVGVAASALTGAIDVWVNNAGVFQHGAVDTITPDKFARIIAVNTLGTVYGSQVAIRQFKQQSSGSHLINVASALGAVPLPYASAYVTSKYAVRGFTASVRQELKLEKHQNIAVSTVMPATIDTPIYQHAATTIHQPTKPLPPVYSVDKAVDTIIQVMDKPQDEVYVGGVGLMTKLYGISPKSAETIMAKYAKRAIFQSYDGRKHEDRSGNLFVSRSEGKVSGGWKHSSDQLKQFAKLGAVVGSIGIWLLFRRKERV